jgi:hypothetical protein
MCVLISPFCPLAGVGMEPRAFHTLDKCSITELHLQPQSSYKDTHHIGLGPTYLSSFFFNHLFKDPVTKYSHIQRLGYVRT